jgi:hypothetical protein
VAKGVNPEDGGLPRRTENTMIIPGNQSIYSIQQLPQDIERGMEVTDSAEQGGEPISQKRDSKLSKEVKIVGHLVNTDVNYIMFPGIKGRIYQLL